MNRHPILPLAILGVLFLSGCVRRAPELGPSDIPRLLEAAEATPYDPEILTQLGLAQYRGRQVPEAAATLNLAVGTGEAPGSAYLYLGLAREDLEDWAGARTAYLDYLERGRYDRMREEIENRLTYIIRQELRAQAQDVVAREEEISAQEPRPGTVAVLPFQLLTEDEELMPLQVALADMMTTDLSFVGGLTVLERAQVQTLLRELALAEAGYTSPETAARTGRLLRSEHLVQGVLAALPEDTLRLDTDVLNVPGVASAGEATAQSSLDDLFDMEKEAVFRVLDILGVDATQSEREAIGQNRAANLLAFLAYGRGLIALDEGNLDQAQAFFDQALAADPGYQAAVDANLATDALVQALQASPFQISSRSGPEISFRTLEGMGAPASGVLTTGTLLSTASILEATTEGLVPSPSGVLLNLGSATTGVDEQALVRDAIQEANGQEGITQSSTVLIRITITLPGGGN